MSRRARILAVSLAALAVAIALAMRSPGVRRQARAVGRRLTRQHAHFVAQVTADHFQRGNVHTHSTRSDGTSSLEAMVAWYRSHGYQFVAMTEHNVRIDSMELASFAAPGFVVIPGEEVTNFWRDKPLHVNALCLRRTVPGGEVFDRADEGLAETLEEIRAEGGVPLVDHPNFHWSLTANDIARGATGRYLLEVWSGHPDVHPGGDAEHPSAEAIWDDVLARGADAVPAAVDDAHGLPDDPAGGEALPGRAWVETFGDETSAGSICAALSEGRLYASNGPALAGIAVQGETFTVATTDAAASVTFLGERGEVLAEVRAADIHANGDARVITYRLSGGEILVRARIADAEGRHAWTAAYRVAG